MSVEVHSIAMPEASPRRLADLLVDLRERLDVEVKEWLDIVGNNDHKATLAKALIALANHGGGFLVFGYSDNAGNIQPAPNRPATLDAYTPDRVNSIVLAYAEPPFHCDIENVMGPDGLEYPIITVPGGHHVPIRAKRDGPNGQIVKSHSYYIRRPGPQSEVPQSAAEWDKLLRRCLSNARDDLVDQIRAILSGTAGAEPPEDQLAATARWFDESLARWNEVVGGTPADSGARFPRGHFAIGYRLVGALSPLRGQSLLDALMRAQIRHTGWPEFWVPTRDELRPYLQDGYVECWIGRDGQEHGAAHSDFWRVSPAGQFFLIRGHQEDEVPELNIQPGTSFDVTLPAWRVGEALLHAANMAGELGDPSAEVILVAEWTGLAGRQLNHLERRRLIHTRRVSQQDAFRTNISVQADQISAALPELVAKIIAPLYELFDFFQIPAALPAEELTRMRSNRF
jgi:hypothetical protein